MSKESIKTDLVYAAVLSAGMIGIGNIEISTRNEHREQVFEVACQGMEELKKFDFTDKNLDIDEVIKELREDHPDGNYGKVTLKSMVGKEYDIHVGDKEIGICFDVGSSINKTSESPNKTSFVTEDGDIIDIVNSNKSAISPDQFKIGRINTKSGGAEIS